MYIVENLTKRELISHMAHLSDDAVICVKLPNGIETSKMNIYTNYDGIYSDYVGPADETSKEFPFFVVSPNY